MANAVIYARYSSAGQRETSIEGQLSVCRDYALKLGYTVIKEYIDRARTGTNDKRPAFQRMIDDSEKNQFQYIIVYMLDRFARNKYDSVVYKYELQKNDVKVLSAMEQITDTDEGRLVEGLLEIMAESYSRKLSVRVKDAFKVSLNNATTLGGYTLLGYKAVDKKYDIDEEKAEIVRFVFSEYANGRSIKEIVNALNAKGLKNNYNKRFLNNSFQHILNNPKYIGKHYIHGELYTNRYPAIIDEATFQKVQERLEKNKRTGGSKTAKAEYLLSGKSRCGICDNTMIGIHGTSKTKAKYYYYACSARYNKKKCTKKHENKEQLEHYVVKGVKNILNKTNIELLADAVLNSYKKDITLSKIETLINNIKNIDRKLDNIVDLLIEHSNNSSMSKKLNTKATDLENQKEIYQKEINKLKLAINIPHERKDIIDYLTAFIEGDINDINYQRRIIDSLINIVFVYEDKLVVYINLLNDNVMDLSISSSASALPLPIAMKLEHQAYLFIADSAVGLLVLRN